MNLKKISFAFLFLTLLLSCNNKTVNRNFLTEEPGDGIYVAAWNLENLFDTVDDPLKRDEDFLPSGENKWTDERLKIKMENLGRVVNFMNEGKGPDILAVQEVENKNVLEKALQFFPERNYKLGYIESPDNRGIDNAVIYDADLFDLTGLNGSYVFLDDKYPTRLILHAVFEYLDNDIHILVNHFPSRRGGAEESEPDRIAAAEVLKEVIEKIECMNSEANIIALGDFNDEPDNRSIKKVLGAQNYNCEKSTSEGLYNLSYQTFEEGTGSYFYRKDWNMLDQIIISDDLTDEYICGSFKIIKPDFMITKSGYYKGSARPTFGGRNYLGGFSDHFPVSAKFNFK